MSDFTHDQGESTREKGLAKTLSATTGEGSAEPAAELRPGDCLGRYTIRELLGAGGMGQVYGALDPALGRAVALKLIHPARLGTSQFRARFMREAQALARLSHPNVVTVYDVGSSDEQTYVAMELIEGVTLDVWLTERRRSWREVRDVLVAAGRGLEAAHAAGLVHRDFKPLNVMVSGERVVVLDFGLARAEGEECDADKTSPAHADPLALSVTLTGELLGTPRYMAPEQLCGAPASARSDQFAFCVALFEGLYGRPPFCGNSAAERAAEERGSVAAPPGARVPRFLAAAVTRGLRADPEARHASMSDLLVELARDPARTARRWLGTGALLASLVATALLARDAVVTARPSCATASAALHERWQPARRQALSAAFAALPGELGAAAWQRTEPVLDRWAARWDAQRVDLCESEQAAPRPSALQAARRACLGRRLVELDSLLAILAVPDATTARYAAGAAHALAAPESCLTATTAVDAPLPAGLLSSVGQARARLDTATALRRVGKPRPGLSVAQAAAIEADRIGWAPFVAEAQLEVGAGQLALRVSDAAGKAFHRALWSAEAAGDDALRFEATMGLEGVDVEGSSYDQAGNTLESAVAIDRRLPADAARGRRLAQAAASLASWRGQFRECVSRGEEAMAQARPDSPELMGALTTVGECRVRLGETDAGAALLGRALAIAEKTIGREQLATANLLSQIASLARHDGRLEDALRDSREVLAIRERIVGPDGPDCAAAHNNLAGVLRELHRLDEAHAEADRALDIWTRAWGPDSPAVAVGLITRSSIAMAEGRPAVAEPDLRRALEMRRKKRGDGHPETVRALELLSEALIAERKPESIALLTEALAVADRNDNVAAEKRAHLRFLLGQAQVELSVDRTGGRARAAAACEELAAAGAAEPLAACRAWLAAHRPDHT